ncbi:MAG TPA: lysophospholipid acyltransferase family protein [Blastocatellia bacterium]|nr:lysophospholipid acyltransferase family protein [Blastocatellia bacterium]
MSQVIAPVQKRIAESEGTLLFRSLRLLCLIFCRIYFRIEFKGLENVPREGPVILAANHESYADPVWLSIPFPYPLRYMTWSEVFKVPLLGSLIRALGAFPVKIEGAGDRSALRTSLQHLKDKGTLVIFPEGGRTRTGQIMPFKFGVIRLALDTDAVIVPVSIIGGYRAFGPHHWIPRPHKIKIIYHRPVYLPPPPSDTESKDYLQQQATNIQTIISSGMDSDH